MITFEQQWAQATKPLQHEGVRDSNVSRIRPVGTKKERFSRADDAEQEFDDARTVEQIICVDLEDRTLIGGIVAEAVKGYDEEDVEDFTDAALALAAASYQANLESLMVRSKDETDVDLDLAELSVELAKKPQAYWELAGVQD